MTATGEQPAAKAEPALTLSLPTVLSIVSLIATLAAGYGNFAVMQERVDQLRADRDHDRDLVAKVAETVNVSHNSRLLLVESYVGDIKASLARIEGKLDGRTSPAVYRGQPRGPGQ